MERKYAVLVVDMLNDFVFCIYTYVYTGILSQVF